MHTTINGWTKERMKAKIREMNNGAPSRTGACRSECQYVSEDNNRCAVGCFFTEDIMGEWTDKCEGHTPADLDEFIYGFADAMPLDMAGLGDLQDPHDDWEGDDGVTLHEAIFQWIDENVEDAR